MDENPQPEAAAVAGRMTIWDLLRATPPWARICAAGVVVIAAANIAAGLALPAGSVARRLCIVTELGVSSALLFALHVAALIYAVPRSDKIGPFDLFLKPITLWKATFRDLPETSRRVTLGAWATAAVWATTLLNGGVRYDWIWKEDWGFEKSAKPNLVQAIVQQARQAKAEEKSMEEGLKDFTGEAGVDPLPEEQKALATDCVIIGYTLSPDGQLGSLLLASNPTGTLMFVGQLPADSIPPDVRAQLLSRMTALQQPTPFVRCNATGIWLRPQLACRIGHDAWTGDSRLKGAQFEQLLADLPVGP